MLETPGTVSLLSPEGTTARRCTSPTGALGGAATEGDGVADAHAVRPTMARISSTEDFGMTDNFGMMALLLRNRFIQGMLWSTAGTSGGDAPACGVAAPVAVPGDSKNEVRGQLGDLRVLANQNGLIGRSTLRQQLRP